MIFVFQGFLTNFILVVNRLTKRSGQNQAEERSKSSQGAFILEVKVLAFLSFFFWFNYVFFLFCLFVYVITCLFSLGLRNFSFLKHARLLDLKFLSTMFLFYGLGLGRVCVRMLTACARILEVCIRIQLGYTHSPMYAHTYSCLETLI